MADSAVAASSATISFIPGTLSASRFAHSRVVADCGGSIRKVNWLVMAAPPRGGRSVAAVGGQVKAPRPHHAPAGNPYTDRRPQRWRGGYEIRYIMVTVTAMGILLFGPPFGVGC